jgi:nucleoside-diphosphate-sugar epimerase
MKILITGIHGFVGSNLVKSLMGTYDIYGLDIINVPTDGIIKTYLWKEIDILPIDFDAIIHLTGKAHDTKNKTEARQYFEINTDLTTQIFNWFLKSNASKFIFFSTVKAVADKVDGDVLTEDVVPKPLGPYGESKCAAENYILSCRTDKLVYIFRPCMIHGEGNKGNLNLLYNFVNNGIPYPLGSFNNRRSFTSISNLSYIINRVLVDLIPAGIYNIADDVVVSTNELVTIIAENLGKTQRIWYLPPFLIKLLALIGTFLHLPFNQERLSKLTENYVVSNSKIKKALNIDQMPVRAHAGLKITIQSFGKK